jgi:hypothetical protein
MANEQAKTPSASTTAGKEASAKAVASSVPPEDKGMPYQRLLVRVLQNSSTSNAVDIAEWELPILEGIWGEDTVEVINDRQEFWPHTATETLAMLKNKYRNKDGESIVDRIYPTARDLAKRTGLSYSPGDNKRSRNQAAGIIDHSGIYGGEITGQVNNSADAERRLAGSVGTGSGTGRASRA